MKVIPYNKLVRDKIPGIIIKSGKTAVTEVLTDEKYIEMLNQKLTEEVEEYFESGSVEELADIGEVMHAIMAYKGITIEEFQRVRLEKLERRGGFKDRILLVEVIESE